MLRRAPRVLLVLTALVIAAPAEAQTETPPASSAPSAPSAPAPAPKAASQGVAVLAGAGATRDDTFGLARAVYASALRPRSLDELRARILAGDPAPASASREVRELAELRASVVSEDAASRRLLSSIAEQMHVAGLVVVTRRVVDAPAAPADVKEGEAGGDAGVEVAPAATGSVSARLFLPDSGEFDAARYEPENTAAGEGTTWRGTVASLAARFPAPPSIVTAQVQGPPTMMPGRQESHPFYTSAWLWGAIGAAALIGGIFFLALQDTSNDPIHLQMRVPR